MDCLLVFPQLYDVSLGEQQSAEVFSCSSMQPQQTLNSSDDDRNEGCSSCIQLE